MDIIIHTDGGSRGNPGNAAIGALIEANRKTLFTISKYIGVATNNDAEYQAVIEVLNEIISRTKNDSRFSDISSITVLSDSTLVVSQLNGLFKIKNPKIRMYILEIRELENSLPCVIRYVSVPREQNKQADILVNHALDRVA